MEVAALCHIWNYSVRTNIYDTYAIHRKGHENDTPTAFVTPLHIEENHQWSLSVHCVLCIDSLTALTLLLWQSRKKTSPGSHKVQLFPYVTQQVNGRFEISRRTSGFRDKVFHMSAFFCENFILHLSWWKALRRWCCLSGCLHVRHRVVNFLPLLN